MSAIIGAPQPDKRICYWKGETFQGQRKLYDATVLDGPFHGTTGSFYMVMPDGDLGKPEMVNIYAIVTVYRWNGIDYKKEEAK